MIALTRCEDIAILTIDNAPVNALDAAVRTALPGRPQACLADASLRAIVLTGAGPHFSAGADIRELDAAVLPDVPPLPQILEDIERASIPVIAALHGTVAGGAFELALACHYRVASPDAAFTLPEVTLGFIPGAGATQRLPRLVGLEAALDLILTGRRMPAAEAHRLGLVDAIATASVVDTARLLVLRNGRVRPRRTCELAAPATDARVIADHDRRWALTGSRAARAAIETMRAGLAPPFAEAMRRERQLFLDLVRSPEAQALRHVFLAERATRTIAGLDAAPDTLPVRTVGVVGCGTMGSGIAMACASAGISVRVLESHPDALARGLASIRKAYERATAKGPLSSEQASLAMARIEHVREVAALADADLVIEAAFERMDVKREIFDQLGAVCRADAILATNTSSLDVSAIADATTHPERVIGMHFFSPAHVMRLVEIVRPAAASATTVATVAALARRLGKIGVVVGVCDGFVGNRMLFAYRRQADFLLEEGALPQQVDAALRAFGFRMGPYQASDLAGLDISWQIRRRQAATRPPHLRYSPLADRLCELGRFGHKTGAGWYRYEPGNRTGTPDPEVTALIEAISREQGRTRRTMTAEEIVERCLFPLVNEGALILEEGHAARPGDIDVIWIHGYGFPRHRGGPMYWADTVGLETAARHVAGLHREQGDLVRPSRLLVELARSGGRFHTVAR